MHSVWTVWKLCTVHELSTEINSHTAFFENRQIPSR